MRKKKQVKKAKASKTPRLQENLSPHDSLKFYSELHKMNEQIQAMGENFEKLQERVSDTEIHINLLTRLITTLCIEKMGMRIGVLKRLLKRIEKEAIRDSQILHLESLYNLPHQSDNKTSSTSAHPLKKDPWDEIS